MKQRKIPQMSSQASVKAMLALYPARREEHTSTSFTSADIGKTVFIGRDSSGKTYWADKNNKPLSQNYR